MAIESSSNVIIYEINDWDYGARSDFSWMRQVKDLWCHGCNSAQQSWPKPIEAYIWTVPKTGYCHLDSTGLHLIHVELWRHIKKHVDSVVTGKVFQLTMKWRRKHPVYKDEFDASKHELRTDYLSLYVHRKQTTPLLFPEGMLAAESCEVCGEPRDYVWGPPAIEKKLWGRKNAGFTAGTNPLVSQRLLSTIPWDTFPRVKKKPVMVK